MKNGVKLDVEICPHCYISMPEVNRIAKYNTNSIENTNDRIWHTYVCKSCGGVLLTEARTGNSQTVLNSWPKPKEIAIELPERSREYLRQALISRKAPAGAIILAASAIDWMLKDKGYTEGSLYNRIDAAAARHLITAEMAAWAHEIRLEANDQRHADEAAPMPTAADSDKVMEFASALSQFLYVLPAAVTRGRKMKK